jgi:hypothetical protein
VNPWTVIGWICLGAMGLVVLALLLFSWDVHVLPSLQRLVLHRRTRNTPPAPGQIWMQGRTYLTVTRIADNGRICLTTKVAPNGNGASWSDSPDDWRERVRARRLWLLSQDAKLKEHRRGV